MMNPGLAAFLTLAAKSLTVADYEAHIQEVMAQRSADADKVAHVALLNTDYVLHYEQAVILGTTAEYEEQTKIWHFDRMLEAVDNQCAEIEMVECVRDLVCNKKFPHNFNTRIMGCN